MLFSQRKGIKPLKSVIQIDTVDTDLRTGLWNAVTVFQQRTETFNNRLESFRAAIKNFWLLYFKLTLDTIPSMSDIMMQLRQDFFNGEWYECYDILEFLVANYKDSGDGVKADLIEDCNKILARELSAYRFVGEQITQITSETEISSIEEALADTQPLKPVHEHLKTALDYLSNRKTPDYRNSIKESICAVEALCSLIAGGKATLGQAIKAVESKINLHPALKGAFSNLYGYTSDANGIRHALMGESNIDFEDAKFMLVSCSAFINYLVSKVAKAGITF